MVLPSETTTGNRPLPANLSGEGVILFSLHMNALKVNMAMAVEAIGCATRAMHLEMQEIVGKSTTYQDDEFIRSYTLKLTWNLKLLFLQILLRLNLRPIFLIYKLYCIFLYIDILYITISAYSCIFLHTEITCNFSKCNL